MWPAHPDAWRIRYPMKYGLGLESKRVTVDLGLHYGASTSQVEVHLDPSQGTFLNITPSGRVKSVRIERCLADWPLWPTPRGALWLSRNDSAPGPIPGGSAAPPSTRASTVPGQADHGPRGRGPSQSLSRVTKKGSPYGEPSSIMESSFSASAASQTEVWRGFLLNRSG